MPICYKYPLLLRLSYYSFYVVFRFATRAIRPLHLIHVILSELYKRKYLTEMPYVTACSLLFVFTRGPVFLSILYLISLNLSLGVIWPSKSCFLVTDLIQTKGHM